MTPYHLTMTCIFSTMTSVTFTMNLCDLQMAVWHWHDLSWTPEWLYGPSQWISVTLQWVFVQSKWLLCAFDNQYGCTYNESVWVSHGLVTHNVSHHDIVCPHNYSVWHSLKSCVSSKWTSQRLSVTLLRNCVLLWWLYFLPLTLYVLWMSLSDSYVEFVCYHTGFMLFPVTVCEANNDFLWLKHDTPCTHTNTCPLIMFLYAHCVTLQGLFWIFTMTLCHKNG